MNRPTPDKRDPRKVERERLDRYPSCIRAESSRCERGPKCRLVTLEAAYGLTSINSDVHARAYIAEHHSSHDPPCSSRSGLLVAIPRHVRSPGVSAQSNPTVQPPPPAPAIR